MFRPTDFRTLKLIYGIAIQIPLHYSDFFVFMLKRSLCFFVSLCLCGEKTGHLLLTNRAVETASACLFDAFYIMAQGALFFLIDPQEILEGTCFVIHLAIV